MGVVNIDKQLVLAGIQKRWDEVRLVLVTDGAEGEWEFLEAGARVRAIEEFVEEIGILEEGDLEIVEAYGWRRRF